MNKLSLVRSITDNSVYSVVVFDEKSAKAIPVTDNSDVWSAWVNDSYATFNDVKFVLDNTFQQEHPIDLNWQTVKSLHGVIAPTVIKQVEQFITKDNFIQDGPTHPTMGTSVVKKSFKQQDLPKRNIFATPLHLMSPAERQAAINFKARRFRTEQKVTALNIQVKRVRAMFDPNIGPGGGWRCPDGTLNGGQITDRFGRGCGGGLTRRIGRALMRAGRRIDDIGAQRDSRRLARRVERAAGRARRADNIRMRRGRVANRLDAAADRLVGDFRPIDTRPGDRGIPSRRPSNGRSRQPDRSVIPGTRETSLLDFEILPTGERGKKYSEMSDEELDAALRRNQPPRVPTDGTIGFMPDSPDTQRRKEKNRRAIEAEMRRRRGEGAPGEGEGMPEGTPQRPSPDGRRPDRVPGGVRPDGERRPGGAGRRPDGERPERRPRPADGGDESDPFDFIEDPEERARIKEALGPYAEQIAEYIRRARSGRGGERGPRRERRGNAGADGEPTPEKEGLVQRILRAIADAFRRLGEFRENRREGRDRRRQRREERRTRIADALDNAANRILDEEMPRRRRGTRRDRDRREVNRRAREAAERVLPDGDGRDILDTDQKRRYREERGIPQNITELNDEELSAILDVLDQEERAARRDPEGFDPFRLERRKARRELRAERRRRGVEQRQAEAPATGRDATPRPSRPNEPSRPRTPEVATPETGDLEGSVPDERSLRNVRNRYPRRGLPRKAVWRDRNRDNYNEADEREMDRRFGRYYDQDGNLNARGRYVNSKLRQERQARDGDIPENEEQNVERQANADFERETGAPAVNDDALPSEPTPAVPEGDQPEVPEWRRELDKRAVTPGEQAAIDQLIRDGNVDELNARQQDLAARRNALGDQYRSAVRDGDNERRDAIVAEQRRIAEAEQNIGRAIIDIRDGRVAPRVDAPESARVGTEELLPGSRPDERSYRNVWNKFRTRGLPAKATWRDETRSGYDADRHREMDRRFGRYYDDNGDINTRGRYVNQRLRARRQEAGGRLDEQQAEEAVVQAERELSQRDATGVPDAGAPEAPVVPPTPPINPNDPFDDEIKNNIDDLERQLADEHSRLQGPAAFTGVDTPPELDSFLERVDSIDKQYRLANAKIRAHYSGEREMSPEELQDTVNYAVRLAKAREAAFPGQGLLFASDDRMSRMYGATRVVDGIFHESFDGDARRDFARMYFALPQALAGAREADDPLDAIDAVIRDWRNSGGGDPSNASIRSILANTPDLNALTPEERNRLIRFAAMSAHNPAQMDRMVSAATGMRVNDLVAAAEATRQLTTLGQRNRQLWDELYNRRPSNASVPERVTELYQQSVKTIEQLQNVLDAQNARRAGITPEGEQFQRAMNQRLVALGTIGPNLGGINLSDPDAQEQLTSASNHVAAMYGGLNRLVNAPLGVDRDRELANARYLQTAIDNGALSMYANMRSDGFLGGELPAEGSFGHHLGQLMALSMTRDTAGNDFKRAQIDAINRAWGIQRAETRAERAAREARERREQMEGLRDEIRNDAEAAARVDQLINGAVEKRRRRLTDVLRRKYPGQTGAPWQRFRERNGQHPITAATWAADLGAAAQNPAKKAAIVDWVKNAYEVEVVASNGAKVRTKIDSVQISNSDIAVYGKVQVVLPDGTVKTTGTIKRYLSPNGRASSSLLKIFDNEDEDIDLASGRRLKKRAGKWRYADDGSLFPENGIAANGQGLASAVNGHSWGWLKDAGFTQVSVATAWDGPYTWGRVGYRPGYRDSIKQIWENADAEVLKFRRGESSIIRSEQQARLVQQLSVRAFDANYEPSAAPAQFELIYALESDDTSRARMGQVRTWILANAPLSSGTMFLDRENFDPIEDDGGPGQAVPGGVPTPRRVSGHGASMLPGLQRPQDPDQRLGQIATRPAAPGDLPEPRVITNPNIRSGADAVNHIRQGGSLSEVPNEFWREALDGNSSTQDVDAQSAYMLVVPQDGAIGDVRIYRLRNDQGKPTNQGIVLKSSAPNGGPGTMYDDVYAEVAGYNLAAAAGLIPEGAGYVGVNSVRRRSSQDQPWIAVPYGPSLAATEGELRVSPTQRYSARLMNDNATDRGIPVRVAHFYHNFFLGVGDRHDRNGGTYVDANGNAIIMPFDMGRADFRGAAGRYPFLRPEATVSQYSTKFGMDRNLFADVKAYSETLPAAQRRAFRAQMLERYDNMVSRYTSVLAGGRDEFIRRMSVGAPDSIGNRDLRAARVERLGQIYDHLKVKVDNARDHRKKLERALSIPRGQ